VTLTFPLLEHPKGEPVAAGAGGLRACVWIQLPSARAHAAWVQGLRFVGAGGDADDPLFCTSKSWATPPASPGGSPAASPCAKGRASLGSG